MNNRELQEAKDARSITILFAVVIGLVLTIFVFVGSKEPQTQPTPVQPLAANEWNVQDVPSSVETENVFVKEEDDAVGVNQEERYAALLEEVASEPGFDPMMRYREAEMAKLFEAGIQDPFWCSPLGGSIVELAEVSTRLGKEDARMWRTHEADFLSTMHICEDGCPAPELERAFEIYTDLGLTNDAKRVAELGAENELNNFIFGGDVYRPWREIPEPLDPMVLAKAIDWFKKAGYSDQQIKKEMLELAKGAEAEGYNAAASVLYESGGDKQKADALLMTALTNPVPSEDVQLEIFLKRVAAAESHP